MITDRYSGKPALYELCTAACDVVSSATSFFLGFAPEFGNDELLYHAAEGALARTVTLIRQKRRNVDRKFLSDISWLDSLGCPHHR